jgi:hypothetical protein
VQAERLPGRAERDARKKSKRRIDGSMNRPIDLKEQATRSTGASEIAAGPPASKKPKRMVPLENPQQGTCTFIVSKCSNQSSKSY